MNPLREASRLLYSLRGQDPTAWEGALHLLTDAELSSVVGCWEFMAHEYQLRPADAALWFLMAARGTGKTRAGAEDTLNVQEDWGENYRGLLCSKTSADVRDVMIYGESGLVPCARRRGYEVEYIANRRTVLFPHGGMALVISSDTDEGFRGPQFNHAWLDEIAKWKNPLYAWNNIDLATRLPGPRGETPTMTITSTPKRGSPIVYHLLKKVEGMVVRQGIRTRDNAANLSEAAIARMERNLGGTTLGLQELEGIFLEGMGSMVGRETIDRNRVLLPPELECIIVSYDPAITDTEDSDDHGIIVCGRDRRDPADGFVLDDQTLQAASPETAANHVVRTAVRWDAKEIVVELNQGGKWIESQLRVAMQTVAAELTEQAGHRVDVTFPIVGVWAKQAKEVRAEPIGALCERGRVHHVGGPTAYVPLETELTEWIPGMPSPNRLDAYVHGMTHLLIGDEPEQGPIWSYTR